MRLWLTRLLLVTKTRMRRDVTNSNDRRQQRCLFAQLPMRFEMLLELVFDAPDVLLRRCKHCGERRAYHAVGDLVQAIGKLRAGLEQVVTMADACAQAALSGRWWCSRFWLARPTELSNDATALLVGRGAIHLALSKALDARGVDHPDGVMSIVEEAGQRFPVPIGCFHTGVHALKMLGGQPILQLTKASRRIGKLPITMVAAIAQRCAVGGS